MDSKTKQEIKNAIEKLVGFLDEIEPVEEQNIDEEELTEQDLEDIKKFCRDESKELSYNEALQHLSVAFRAIRKLMSKVDELEEKVERLERESSAGTSSPLVNPPYQPYQPYPYVPQPSSPYPWITWYGSRQYDYQDPSAPVTAGYDYKGMYSSSATYDFGSNGKITPTDQNHGVCSKFTTRTY